MFVPGCLLCPELQAGVSEKRFLWPSVFNEILNSEKVTVMQMPCPEGTFLNIETGIGRKPHGITFYEDLDGFRLYCKKLGKETAEQFLSLHQEGKRNIVVLGVEHSPTCAVSYMYTNHGTLKRPGLYMEQVMKAAELNNATVSYIGINRRFPQKAVQKLKYILSLQG